MNDFTKILGFFFSRYQKQTILVITLIVLAGLAEALGLAAFLPFFQIVLEGQADLGHIPDGALKTFITASDIPINFISVSLFIATAIALKALILWLALRHVGLAVAQIAADLRRRLIQALLKANWRFFTHHALGTSLNAIVMESFRSSMAFVSTARFISALVQFSVYATGALLLSWQTFLGALIIGLILVAILWTLIKVARSAGQKQTELAKDMLTHMADMLQGIKPLRAMALENKFMNILFKHSCALEKSQSDQLISTQSMRVFHEPLMVATAVIGLYVAITFGDLSSSALAVMAVIFIKMLGSMNAAQAEYQRLMVQESALWSLMDTIRETEDSADNWPGREAPPENIQTLRFESVDFAHEGTPVLSGLDLEFKRHSMTALIGASGSGKTTILDLLCGFFAPDQGRITVNDQDLNTIKLEDWRHAIGFVPQDVFLFNDTILENILVGRDDINEQDVWDALEAAGAKEFVQSLPDQLSAPVGEGGRKLSGGQRQRIAIARAIVHRPQILILDEATSALDTETEKVLLETLRKLAKDITVIFVSHNKAVQDYADVVYTL